ncbi:hypothetical protein ATO1_15145 [Phaeobacter sp. 22II1-1F12B]|nr:hypothetical protein ATO1_15145 [Phaeobacter sp. 22II1-1F12B]
MASIVLTQPVRHNSAQVLRHCVPVSGSSAQSAACEAPINSSRSRPASRQSGALASIIFPSASSSAIARPCSSAAIRCCASAGPQGSSCATNIRLPSGSLYSIPIKTRVGSSTQGRRSLTTVSCFTVARVCSHAPSGPMRSLTIAPSARPVGARLSAIALHSRMQPLFGSIRRRYIRSETAPASVMVSSGDRVIGMIWAVLPAGTISSTRVSGWIPKRR